MKLGRKLVFHVIFTKQLKKFKNNCPYCWCQHFFVVTWPKFEVFWSIFALPITFYVQMRFTSIFFYLKDNWMYFCFVTSDAPYRTKLCLKWRAKTNQNSKKLHKFTLWRHNDVMLPILKILMQFDLVWCEQYNCKVWSHYHL